MISYSKEDLLSKIDSMVIYENDYNTIKKLLHYDPRLVAAILEEVIKGNLYWSDFENILPDEYSELLESTLESQEKLTRNIEMIRKFNQNTTDIENEILSTLGITSTTKSSRLYDFWNEEAANIKEDFIYSLLLYKDTDNAISRNVKAKLLNLIENGKIVINDPVLNANGISASGSINVSGNLFHYIDPNALFISKDELVIPINYDDIQLSDSDKVFIRQNNIITDDMAKIKALYIYLNTLDRLNGGS